MNHQKIEAVTKMNPSDLFLDILNKSVEKSMAVVLHINGMNPITTKITGFDSDFVEFVLPDEKGQLKAIIRRDDVRIVVDLNKSFEDFLKEVKAIEDERRARIEKAVATTSEPIKAEEVVAEKM